MYKLIDSHLQTSLRHIRITDDTYNLLPFYEQRLYKPEQADQRFNDIGRSLLDNSQYWSDNMDADF